MGLEGEYGISQRAIQGMFSLILPEKQALGLINSYLGLEPDSQRPHSAHPVDPNFTRILQETSFYG